MKVELELTAEEVSWLLETVTSYKESCYDGKCEEAVECWDSKRFDMDEQEFELVKSLFDKLRPV